MNTQFENIAGPIKEINELTTKNFEAVASLQLKAVEENTKVGIEQVKTASTINDADSLKSYLDSQLEITRQFNERLVENSRVVIELGNTYTNELRRIVKDAFAVK
jgi:phasin family protein